MSCPDCISGTLSADQPTGTETTIHGLPTYVARPQGDFKGIIVYITDAFGWKFQNSRVLADRYAAKGGYLVYVPDFMNGNACNPSVLENMDILTTPSSWLHTIFVKPLHALRALSVLGPFMFTNRPSVCEPRILDFCKALRRDPTTANLPIGAAGFCWGGRYTVYLAQDNPSSREYRGGDESAGLQPLIDAGFTGHPSALKMPDDIDKVTKPLSIAIGDVDMVMNYEAVKKAKAILEKKDDGQHEVVVYPGAKHGFAVRGNPNDENVKEMAAQAEKQALDWFAKWLK